MKIVRDNLGKEWILKLNYSAALRIRSEHGINLTSLKTVDKLVDSILDDLTLAIRMAWSMVEDRNSVTFDEFADRFTGDSLDRLIDAVLEECFDFFPFEKMRTAFRLGWHLGREEIDRNLDKMIAKMHQGQNVLTENTTT